MKTNRKGFTLVEIMIVVAIIGILAVIAIPNFIRARRTSQMNACVANLKQVQGAVEQYKLAGKAAADATVTMANLMADTAGDESFLKAEPKCPINSSDYTMTAAGPTCPNNNTTTHDVHSKVGIVPAT